MTLLKGLFLLATVTTLVSGSSMMQSFKAYRDEKANQHVLPDSAKGVICEKSGSAPKSYCCYNRHGVRCSPDFQAEWDTCPGAGCQVETKLGECPYPLPDHARECENHYDDDEWYRMLHSCKTNGDMQESLCPQPCGCVLEGQPKRESSSTMKTHKIFGLCGSEKVNNQMRNVLTSWKVPGNLFLNYEMAAWGDSSTFVVFDLFIQPKENEARYKLALGAARCHNFHMEIGYMDTGMWKVDTLNNYKCHWRGGCSKVGIAEESIEKARIVLEHYAWKNLHVGGRRLSEAGDSMDDLFVDTLGIPESTEDGRDGLRGAYANMNMGRDSFRGAYADMEMGRDGLRGAYADTEMGMDVF